MKTPSCLGLSCVLALLSAPLFATVRFVSPLGAGVPPFLSWNDAATNIQDAIEVASAGDVIWVTNGVYARGGKAIPFTQTNRVALYKALTVQSVNGPEVTTIQGTWNPGTSSGVRCAWVTNGAILSGFTLEGGGNQDAGALICGEGICISPAGQVLLASLDRILDFNRLLR